MTSSDAGVHDPVPPSAACPAGSIGCFAVRSTAATEQERVPVTVGQAFARGDLPAGAVLTARDSEGRPVEVQLDQPARHADGSVRFGVVSALIPKLPAQARETVALYLSKEAPRGAPSPLSPDALTARGYDTRIELLVYSPQVTVVRFGNREAATAGIPFEAGDVITLEVGADPVERYSLTVTPALAGGGVSSLRELAKAFLPVINKSSRFRAYKVDEPYGDENIWITSKEGAGDPFDVAVRYAGRARIRTSVIQQREKPQRYVASAGALLKRAGKEKPPHLWLSGPVATEYVLTEPFRAADTGAPHPHLAARFHVRAYAGGAAVRTDAIIENDWAYEPGPRNWNYDALIRIGDRKIYEKRGLVHYHHARWHKVGWFGPEPGIVVVPDASALVRSRVVPNYDLALPMSDRLLGQLSDALARSDTEPMGNGLVTQYMPTTGGRSDIGFLPDWSVLHLLSASPRAAAIDLANGDVAGGVPIHYRDRTTDTIVSLDDHPGMTMGLGKPSAKDAFPALANAGTNWVPDVSHQPALAYMPYLATGDLFYLDELMFWANWNMARTDPGYRRGAKGIIVEQVRGEAWALRSLGQVLAVIPERHPMRRYFEAKLANNINRYIDEYVRPSEPAGEKLSGYLVSNSTAIAPWQNDFVFVVVGFLADQDIPGARTLLKWLAKFTVGIWANEKHGYCAAMAPAYYLKINGKDGRKLVTWEELFRENFPGATACPSTFPPGTTAGYVAYANAALATAANHGIHGGAEAYDALRRMAPWLQEALAKEPTWAIVPRR